MTRVHIIGLAHLPITEEVQACAFTQKIIKLIKQLKMFEYEVYLYGVGASPSVIAQCDKFVQSISDTFFNNSKYANNLQTKDFFVIDDQQFNHTMATIAAFDILRNLRDPGRDIVCVPFGNFMKSATDLIGNNAICVESGIGYSGTYLDNRVYESYAWMHTAAYVWDSVINPNFVVIPNCINPNDKWYFNSNKEDYLLYYGRLLSSKGVNWAIDAAVALDKKLVMFGQGNIEEFVNDSNRNHVEYLGVINDREEKAKIVANAKCMLMPTQYIEPFGTVSIECMISGTPVMTTDWGVFTETNQNGVTGFRARTYNQFLKNIQRVDEIDPLVCHNYAKSRFSLEVTAKQYDEYFKSLLE